jgi:Family of unknown function (DUF6455)
MIAYPNASQAWARTRAMARAAGVDLIGAVVEGWLTRRDLDDLVGACNACAQNTACASWGASPTLHPDLPAFCSNKSGLESLRL